MPSPFTSSFASAAAGNNTNEGGSSGRNAGSGDWSRARPNGTTQTFRRPSVATTLSHQKDGSQANSNPPSSVGSVYVPPHMNANYHSSFNRNGAAAETRYSKDQLLDLFKAQDKVGHQGTNLNDLYVDGWRPKGTYGLSNGGWGKSQDHKDALGPEICWDHEGSVHPMALVSMSDEERELFSTSVNSPLKLPTQNKENTLNNGSINRRTSITQSQNAMNNSPASRPGARHRDSSDFVQSINSLASPTGNRFSRDEPSVSSPPPSLLRRKTDLKDNFGPSLQDGNQETTRPSIDTASPFGTLKRTSTNPVSAGLNGPSSPWSAAPPSSGFAPMGAFGAFGSSQTPTSGEKKPGFGSMRGESRFKGLMGGDSSENMNSKVKEKASVNSLERLTESTIEQSSRWGAGRSLDQSGHQREVAGEDDRVGTGSAALGGDDASPPLPQSSRYRNHDRQASYDDIGFSSLNVSADLPPFRELRQRRDFSHQQTPQRSQATEPMHEPMSPTDTNPYQSPEGQRAVPEDFDTDEPDPQSMQYRAGAPFGHTGRGLPNPFDLNANDRSQTSSASALRVFPGIGGLGSLAGLGNGPWSAAPGAIGTPSRAQPSYSGVFGDSAFNNFGDIQSPSQIGIGFFGAGGPSTVNHPGPIGSGSKLGSLFPNAIQDQMGGDTPRQEQGFGDGSDAFQRSAATNAPGFGLGAKNTDEPPHLGRGSMDDLLVNLDSRNRGLQGFPSYANETSQGAVSQAPLSAAPSSSTHFSRTQEQDSSSISSAMPASQQRRMVMPDCMRWVYRDPSGSKQGPWSGLEMHDWYKAGFFSPELQVKKFEDADYEPLAQLIRRIGNSREPFLVPQIGIPHGSSTLPGTGAAAVPAATPSSAQSSSAQPPFASSFPSFGTTLTAEQQNALERRKQEEQYLMARQKEHLAQQQVMLKQMQHMQGGIHGQQLHHHSSAHSLQSQPSYGSITSPMGYQPSPAQGPIQPPAAVPNFYDGQARNAGPLGADTLASLREEELPGLMERLNAEQRGGQAPFGQEGPSHHQVNAMLYERARQQREQEQYDVLHRGDNDARLTSDRLQQYHRLRAQEDEQQQYQPTGPIGGHVGRQSSGFDLSGQQQREALNSQSRDRTQLVPGDHQEPLSLSEQVQKAAAKQDPAVQPQSPWGKVDSGMPQPFPPPQSSTPLPAPTAQRNRQSVADALNAESQSQSPSQADSADTPSAAIAPWAKENNEASKGPSLKEIQAVEARKAAQQEDTAAAARRAIAEQERLNQQNHAVAPAPGLPSSANWANSISPAIPATSGTSPWAKPAVATPVTGAKKTLAQIQKEEESRKNRAVAASNPSSVAASAGGKRYADLASKATFPLPQASNAAWTTVGAGGKVKTPIAPAPSLNTRTASGGIVQPQFTASKIKPTISTAAKNATSQQNANDEFQHWTKNALSNRLSSNIPVDDLVNTLLHLPAETDIISDSIYASSQTLDGRRFAEEFIRRRKLADSGIIPDASSSGNTGFFSSNLGHEGKNGGGWSEVAKKGGNSVPPAAKEEANFKVVAGKKRGGKR